MEKVWWLAGIWLTLSTLLTVAIARWFYIQKQEDERGAQPNDRMDGTYRTSRR